MYVTNYLSFYYLIIHFRYYPRKRLRFPVLNSIFFSQFHFQIKKIFRKFICRWLRFLIKEMLIFTWKLNYVNSFWYTIMKNCEIRFEKYRYITWFISLFFLLISNERYLKWKAMGHCYFGCGYVALESSRYIYIFGFFSHLIFI